jgi:Glycosyltransferase like family 2
VLLNNDVVVPPGAVARLLRHLDDDSVGLVGPVSNEAASEAEVDAGYRTYGELVTEADERARAHAGELLDVPMLTMFCVALRRELYELVGPLDERFEVGLFEDDDYSLRIRRAGFRVVCAEDVLVHHSGEAAFGKLVATGEYAAVFEANRRRFEEKWDVQWQQHGRRSSDEYRHLVERVRELVRNALPRDATVLVISKGDDSLLELDGRPSGHFPQVEGGVYAGHYPADSDEAIAQLEALRARGAGFLVVPQPSLWWLDHYDGLRRYLHGHSLRTENEEECAIFDLRGVSNA